MKPNEKNLDHQEVEKLKADLTELQSRNKRLENENKRLKSDLKKYDLSLYGGKESLWNWNIASGEIFLPGHWQDILGLHHDTLNSIESFKRLIHPNDHESSIDSLFQRLKKPKEHDFEFEFRLLSDNDVYRWFHTRGYIKRDKRGKAISVSGSIADIHERKQSEEALRRSQKKYKNLFDNSLVGMFRSNIETGELIEANPKIWEILQIEPHEGLTLIDVYANIDDRDKLRKELFLKGKLENYEVQIKRKDGSKIWVSISAVAYPDEGYSEVVVLDITKNKESLLELQKVNFELDNFVYHASHDLRSPLRSILGLVSIVKAEKIKEKREYCLEMIEGSVKRLDNLVVDLLSLSRNNRINEPHKTINFLIEINNAVTNFYHVADTQNLIIRLNVRQPVRFISDKTRISIVLNNLISNAIKYRSYERELSYINISLIADEKKAIFTVEDNGEGIAKEKLPNIFDMFFRASEKSQGSGLGLYIVKNVIDKLGGKISIDSEEGQGTTMEVIMPNFAYTKTD